MPLRIHGCDQVVAPGHEQGALGAGQIGVSDEHSVARWMRWEHTANPSISDQALQLRIVEVEHDVLLGGATLESGCQGDPFPSWRLEGGAHHRVPEWS